ncbi:PREDICTED: RNMT-activating mini protein [Gekko japonicus]|uniref:RNMT-activating mini protein n=1 Tax=Gekko japonicus TaxID=146911 RepID=A0ABM1L1I7_GEKJA|nr:PREDICTED: RNMT-activating mini protein [Gekko japonicus]
MASTPDTLQHYEEMFTHRFTSEDKEYQKYVHRPADQPPVVEDWLNRERKVPSTLEILQNYEKMFANRFTLEDEEYQKYIQRPTDPPPLIGDWRSRSGGHRYRDRFQDGRQFRGRGERYDRHGGYRSGQWQERGWGNSYQQHREPHYAQYGYSSYSSRPKYDYY